jgi:DNA (cytosine-5)-methyltransferase 1
MKNKALVGVSEAVSLYSPLTCAEYFAGIGLVRLGLEQVGWNVVFANDWANRKFEMYSAQFKDASNHYRVQDIFSICPTDIPDTLLAIASFPCIDLSLAGNLEGLGGQHSSAFWGFTKILNSQAKKRQETCKASVNNSFNHLLGRAIITDCDSDNRFTTLIHKALHHLGCFKLREPKR